MQILPYRRWCPPASPLRITFPADLPLKLWPEPEQLESSGALFGICHGGQVHVLTAREGEGFEKIGIFIARARGEVFLTEANLGLFERHQATVALVRAGDKAGFFVREPNGAIQTVRSHEEFPVHELPPPPLRTIPAAARTTKPVWAAAGFLTLMLPLLAFFRPSPALGLEVREQSGQLQISWQPGQPALLEIRDGERNVALPVFADQSNLTYTRNSAQVDVSLTREDGSAHPLHTTTRFVAGAAPR